VQVLNRNQKTLDIESRNPLLSTTADSRDLINGLNRDLSGEYQAVLMYTQFAAKLTGPHRWKLRDFFLSGIVDEQGHAQFLADTIAAMGGEPTAVPRPVPRGKTPAEMLDKTLVAERISIANHAERIRQAEDSGDIGLKSQLENQVSDETRHKNELERIIAGWDQR
jgi:bacterioferritin